MNTKEFIQLLKNDDTEALEKFYIKQDYTNIDFQEVYDKVKNLNNGSVNNILGYIHSRGKLGVIDYQKGYTYFKLSAKQGNSIGQYNLGMEHFDGNRLVVERNFEKALKYLEMSASQNNAFAYYGLSKLPLTYVNKDKHLFYLKLAADKGLKFCQYEIAQYYHSIYHYTEAVEYYKMSAEQGDVDSNLALGIMYKDGVKVQQNLMKALKHLKFVADDSHHKWHYKELKSRLGDIPNYVNQLERENEEQKQEIERLKLENTDLRYRPGSVGYKEAKEDFESHL